MFFGPRNERLSNHIFATSPDAFHYIFHAIPYAESHYMEKPKATRRNFVSLQHVLLFLCSCFFHFLDTCCCTGMIVIVRAQPTIILCKSFLVSCSILNNVLGSGYSSTAGLRTNNYEVLKCTIFTETAGILQGNCRPVSPVLRELAVVNYVV